MQISRISNQNFTSHHITERESGRLRRALMNRQAFLYDVDTTDDFMRQSFVYKKDEQTGGDIKVGFSVKGADQIIPALLKLRDVFLGKILKLESVDAHTFDDPEIKYFKFVSDIHNEKGTKEAEKIPETVFREPDYLIEVEPWKDDVPSLDKIKKAFIERQIIRIEKNETSVLRYGNGETQDVEVNRKAKKLFENLKDAGAKIALVYGVAEDYCVKDAVVACKKHGITPIVVEDAVKEASEKVLYNPDDPVYRDVATITTAELEKMVGKLKYLGKAAS